MREGQRGNQCGCRVMRRERSSNKGREGSHRALPTIIRTLVFILKLGASAGSGAEKGHDHLIFSKHAAPVFSGACSAQGAPFSAHQISFPSPGPHGPLLPFIEQHSLCAHLGVCVKGREGERCAPALVKASTLWKR